MDEPLPWTKEAREKHADKVLKRSRMTPAMVERMLSEQRARKAFNDDSGR